MENDEPDVRSSFFNSQVNFKSDVCKTAMNDICEDFLDMINELNDLLNKFVLPHPVECIYNPTIYARETFEMYVRKYCNTKKRIMYFGMNPGPWGMSQTGVPFGEISSVKDWLGIKGAVEKPYKELKTRPILGFECPRTEISGKRFWGLFRDICGEPSNFFDSSFVYNYIPQQWMKRNGCNVTPGDFKISQMQELFDICDPIFVKVLKLYEVKTVVAIGKFCETRAQKAIQKYYPSSPIDIVYLPHPSPRTVNNNNWNEKALECLRQLNLLQYYKKDCIVNT